MPDYTNGKIYKLFSYDNDLVYIGSTIQKLSERLSKHKGICNTSSSKILFENSANVKIELIEKFPCDCKEELVKREGHFIREIDCVNKVIIGRTHKEWYKDNVEYVKTRSKKFAEDNKEKVLEYKQKYYEETSAKLYTCECGKTLRFGGKARHEKSKFHIKYCEEQN